MLTRNFIEILKIKWRNFKNRAGPKKSIHNVWLFWDGRDYYFLNVFVKCMNIKSGSVDYLYIIITKFFYFFFLFNLYISIHKLWTKKLKSFMMLSLHNLLQNILQTSDIIFILNGERPIFFM